MRHTIVRTAAGLTVAGVALAAYGSTAGAATLSIDNIPTYVVGIRVDARIEDLPSDPTSGSPEVQVVDLDLGDLGFVDVHVNTDRSVTGQAGMFRNKEIE